MKPELIDFLVCPTCRNRLDLKILKKTQDDDIEEGNLKCRVCDSACPIQNGIPNLLPPDLRKTIESENEILPPPPVP